MRKNYKIYVPEEIEASSVTQKRAEEFCSLIQSGSSYSKAAEEALIRENYGLIHYVAKKILTVLDIGMLDYEDICQEAAIGMLTAAKKYSKAKGKFSTHAVIWMDSVVRRAIQNHSKTIRIPSCKWSNTGDEEKKTLKDLANVTNLLSLDEAFNEEDEDSTLLNCIAAKGNFEDDIARRDTMMLITSVMETMSPVTKEAILLKFGFVTGEQESLAAIGDHLGITAEAVRQRIARGLKELKTALLARGISYAEC